MSSIAYKETYESSSRLSHKLNIDTPKVRIAGKMLFAYLTPQHKYTRHNALLHSTIQN